MQLIFLPGAAGEANMVCNCKDDIRAIDSVDSGQKIGGFHLLELIYMTIVLVSKSVFNILR